MVALLIAATTLIVLAFGALLSNDIPRMVTFAFVVLMPVFPCGIFASEPTETNFHWVPPPEGVVRDKSAAIAIAHAVWFSMYPQLKKSSEEIWEKGMTAQLRNGVWQVREQPLGPNDIGGGLLIDINAKDGKILMVMLTQ